MTRLLEMIGLVLNEPATYIVLYLSMMINTFGHCWVSITNTPGANEAGIMLGSIMCSFFWPLYWSVKFWS